MGVLKKGFPEGLILAPSIFNLILSKIFPERVLKTVGSDRKYV